MKNTKQPIETLRCNNVKAAISEIETDDDVQYTVTFSLKSWKDNKWQSTPTFGANDMLALITVAQMAHHSVMFHEIADGKLRLIG